MNGQLAVPSMALSFSTEFFSCLIDFSLFFPTPTPTQVGDRQSSVSFYDFF